ncbi:hypothetical protein Nmel_011155, partial [Mimus melanotis]
MNSGAGKGKSTSWNPPSHALLSYRAASPTGWLHPASPNRLQSTARREIHLTKDGMEHQGDPNQLHNCQDRCPYQSNYSVGDGEWLEEPVHSGSVMEPVSSSASWGARSLLGNQLKQIPPDCKLEIMECAFNLRRYRS